MYRFGTCGPPETSVWSSVLKVDANETVRIGGPIANTTFYVLDAGQQPVPFGGGELYIGGEGVAQGYFNALNLPLKSSFVTHLAR